MYKICINCFIIILFKYVCGFNLLIEKIYNYIYYINVGWKKNLKLIN